MFIGNFQGTYMRPGNSWDLRACTQKPGESLRDFIRHFSKGYTEHAFLVGTTIRDLVRELGRSQPVDSNELFDIATSFAFREEAVGLYSTERRASVRMTRPQRETNRRNPSRNTSGARRARSHAVRHAR
jgi:hypothetical protein